MAHCDLCGVTYLSERGHTCESVSGSTAIGFARATAAINTTHIAQAFPCPDCGQPKVTGSVCDTSRCRARAAPTPAAPAGSEWLTTSDAELEEGRVARRPWHLAQLWFNEAHAQRAAREAAERERDEALERERRWQAGFEERLTAAESVIPGARAALAASTEREAGLRARLAAWIEEQKAAAPLSHDSAAYALLLLLEGELASLAAPEGGTGHPTGGDQWVARNL